ncbi:MAG: 5-deoxy-glucuronate isomerase [Armatimonadota bacterium]|nr:5-deoxy-glucuronate isomerase [Armatimonadota bacterium]MCX7776577.1 5-deoxy-glucuronate isomerase [Armatimonadota bacterium]MDW8026089.1 5-deoxy-glucuronate isomerase [Armatimonadota bacterium]
MSSLGTFIRGQSGKGLLKVVSPEASNLKRLEFDLLRLSDGERFDDEAIVKPTNADKVLPAEVAVVLLSGACSLCAGDDSWEGLQFRRDVFSGKATALYVPPRMRYSIVARGELEAAIVRAVVSDEDGTDQPVLITPKEVKRRTVGFLNWRREIDDIIDSSFPARRLLLGETRNPPGNWSSYPPHKHDKHNPPYEVKLEEVYHYRISPSHGFGVQLLYSDECCESYVIRDGDTLAISEGYHPVVVAPGYQLYYLWALAGDERKMQVRFEEAHTWVLAMEAVIATMQTT